MCFWRRLSAHQNRCQSQLRSLYFCWHRYLSDRCPASSSFAPALVWPASFLSFEGLPKQSPEVVRWSVIFFTEDLFLFSHIFFLFFPLPLGRCRMIPPSWFFNFSLMWECAPGRVTMGGRNRLIQILSCSCLLLCRCGNQTSLFQS